MAGMSVTERVRTLPTVPIPGHVATSTGNEDHPMRLVTRRAAGLAPGGWDAETLGEVASFFNSLAGEWHTRDTPERRRVVQDSVDRGLSAATGTDRPRFRLGVEPGSGTGIYSEILGRGVDTLISVDVAEDMLRLAPPAPGLRILADSARLPVRGGAVDLVALVNMFLFPDEVARVLRPGGVLLWVNVSGAETPIHLDTAEVVRALPFDVEGVESSAGIGTWCALRRVG